MECFYIDDFLFSVGFNQDSSVNVYVLLSLIFSSSLTFLALVTVCNFCPLIIYFPDQTYLLMYPHLLKIILILIMDELGNL